MAQYTTFSITSFFIRRLSQEFLWENFTNSKDSMDKANAAFEESVRDKMFPLFSEFAQCQAIPRYDLYNGYKHYIGLNKNILCQVITAQD